MKSLRYMDFSLLVPLSGFNLVVTPSDSLVIRVTKPHLVYQKFQLKNPLLVGKKAKSEYFLLMRDKEQQIEVKINLSPENYRQFLETMTEEQ